MMSRLPISAAFAPAAAVFLGNGMSALLGVVALRLYTELAPPDVYGTANLIIGTLTLAIQCVIQPVSATQIRYHTLAVADGHADAFTAEALFVAVAGTTLLGVASAAALVLFLSGSLSYSLATAVAAGLWLVLSGVRSTFMGRLHAEQRMRSYMSLRVLESALTIVVTCLLLFAFPPHPASLIVGQCVGFLGVLSWFAARAPWPALCLATLQRPTAGFWAKLLEYGAPFIPLAILYWLAGLADRYVLATLMGPAAAGKYFAAFIIAAAGFGIANSIMGDLFRPKLFAAENAGEFGRADKIFLAWLGTYAVLSTCILIGIAAFGDLLIWFAISAAYRDGAIVLLLWIGTGFAVSGLSTAFENRLLSYGCSKKLLVPVAVGAISNLVLSYFLIKANGIPGAAQSSCVSFAIQLICTGVILQRAAAQQIDETATGQV